MIDLVALIVSLHLNDLCAIIWMVSRRWRSFFSGKTSDLRYREDLSRRLKEHARRLYQSTADLYHDEQTRQAIVTGNLVELNRACRIAIEQEGKIPDPLSRPRYQDLIRAAVEFGSPDTVRYLIDRLSPLHHSEIIAIYHDANPLDLPLWRTIVDAIPALPAPQRLVALDLEILDYLLSTRSFTEEEQRDILLTALDCSLTTPVIELLVTHHPLDQEQRCALIEELWKRDRLAVATYLIRELESYDLVVEIFWKMMQLSPARRLARWMINHCGIDLSPDQYGILFQAQAQLGFALQRATRETSVRYYCDTRGHHCIISKKRMNLSQSYPKYREYQVEGWFLYTDTMIYHVLNREFVSYRERLIPREERSEVPLIRYGLKCQNRVIPDHPPFLEFEIVIQLGEDREERTRGGLPAFVSDLPKGFLVPSIRGDDFVACVPEYVSDLPSIQEDDFVGYDQV